MAKIQNKLNILIDCAIKNTENLVRIMFLHRLIAPVKEYQATVGSVCCSPDTKYFTGSF